MLLTFFKPGLRDDKRQIVDTLLQQTSPDAVVISGLSPVYLRLFLPQRILLPASERVEYASKQVPDTCLLQVGCSDAPQQIAKALADNKRVSPAAATISQFPGFIKDMLSEDRGVFVAANTLDEEEQRKIRNTYCYDEPVKGLWKLKPCQAHSTSAAIN